MRLAHILVTTGIILGIGAFFSSKSNVDKPKVPVPFVPKNARVETKAYKYRGYYIGLEPVPDQGYLWRVFGTTDFDIVPLAMSNDPALDVIALEEAMKWIDTFRGKTP